MEQQVRILISLLTRHLESMNDASERWLIILLPVHRAVLLASQIAVVCILYIMLEPPEMAGTPVLGQIRSSCLVSQRETT